MPATRKLWAIGFKSWVEIRAASKPPRGEVTQVVKPRKEKAVIGYGIDTVTGNFTRQYGEVDTSVKIKVIVYVGGTVVEVIPKNSFYLQTGRTVRDGKRMELTSELIRRLAGKYKKLGKYVIDEIKLEVEDGGTNVAGLAVGVE